MMQPGMMGMAMSKKDRKKDKKEKKKKKKKEKKKKKKRCRLLAGSGDSQHARVRPTPADPHCGSGP